MSKLVTTGTRKMLIKKVSGIYKIFLLPFTIDQIFVTPPKYIYCSLISSVMGLEGGTLG